jgi:dimethylargininase
VAGADANPQGFIEGGDIMITGREVLVGLSSRTNEQGYYNLKSILDEYGYASRVVITPPQILHFKTASGLIDEETILSTRELATSDCFEGYRLLLLPDGEEPAANAIRVNDKVFIAVGYPKTADLLTDAGYSVEMLPNGEAAKLDGGLSCMSLRFGA